MDSRRNLVFELVRVHVHHGIVKSGAVTDVRSHSENAFIRVNHSVKTNKRYSSKNVALSKGRSVVAYLEVGITGSNFNHCNEVGELVCGSYECLDLVVSVNLEVFAGLPFDRTS